MFQVKTRRGLESRDLLPTRKPGPLPTQSREKAVAEKCRQQLKDADLSWGGAGLRLGEGSWCVTHCHVNTPSEQGGFKPPPPAAGSVRAASRCRFCP